jgi:hypothetical protein
LYEPPTGDKPLIFGTLGMGSYWWVRHISQWGSSLQAGTETKQLKSSNSTQSKAKKTHMLTTNSDQNFLRIFPQIFVKTNPDTAGCDPIHILEEFKEDQLERAIRYISNQNGSPNRKVDPCICQVVIWVCSIKLWIDIYYMYRIGR